MAKRGYKLQEFVAHSANVNCLKIGKKTRRNFITGGDDEKVNLWSIGKPTAITSLSGHTSPIESVAFDATEVLVAAGASSGVIKLWDLEETKVVRTLNGHRSYCTAVEFHPFGEFFASGSMDTNLKIWDIRKKGCIHTYKGHRRAVSTIRFSPDGRWVVSGGLDNVVKIWDLTAGKLLHEFKFHEGHIRAMDFHPLEFLLATGSSDRTVKFWDLETFELIGSTRPEATGVRSVTFHPDGRSLFCGLDSSLKVYSWEPIVCHDSLDMGWSTLGDLCIDDGKLLGCSYYQNSVAVWVADTTQIEPHAHGILSEEKSRVQQKFNIQEDLTEKVGSQRKSTMPPDDDTKDIKNIYVDSVTPVPSRKSASSPKVTNLPNPKETENLVTQKQVPTTNNIMPRVNSSKDLFKSSRESIINEQETTNVSVNKPSHRRRPSTTKLNIEGLSLNVESGLKNGPDSDSVKVTNFQKRVLEKDAVKDSSEEKPLNSVSVDKELRKASSPQEKRDESVDSNKGVKSVKYVNGVAVVHGRTRSLVERFEKREKLNTEESQMPDVTNTDMPTPRVKPSIDTISETKTSPVQVKTPEANISHMALKTADVAPCEEREDKTSHVALKIADVAPVKESEAKTSYVALKNADVAPFKEPEAKTSYVALKTADVSPSEEREVRTSHVALKNADMAHFKDTGVQIFTVPEKRQNMFPIADVASYKDTEAKRSHVALKNADVAPSKEPEIQIFTVPEKRPNVGPIAASKMPLKGSDVAPLEETEAKTSHVSLKTADVALKKRAHVTPFGEPTIQIFTVPDRRPNVGPTVEPDAKSSPLRRNMKSEESNSTSSPVSRPRTAPNSTLPEKGKASPLQRSVNSRPRVMPERVRSSSMLVTRRSNPSPRAMPERTKTPPVVVVSRHGTPNRVTTPEKAKSSPLVDDGPQTTGRILTSKKDDDVAEDLMLNHEVFLSSLRSRLTKLQVVKHFWEKNDTKGAINALRKLPDHAVQADVVNVLMEKLDSLNLDLFSCLLPVLLDLLDSKTERHISVSLELLLKLVAVFGPVITSTVSAPPTVGVDLHAEKRLEICNQCHIQLQKIHKCLPAITRRGGLPARCAQELNVILERS